MPEEDFASCLSRLSYVSRSVFCVFSFLIFLSCSYTAYSVTEGERLDMNQRAESILQEILSTEEFAGQDSQPYWWEKLLGRLFNVLPSNMGWAGTTLEWLFYILAGLAIVWVFTIVVKRLRRSSPFKPVHEIPAEIQRHMDPGAVKMQAYEAYHEGDYKQAIRYLYLSLLLYLNKTELLAYDVGKTDGEYVDEVCKSMADKSESFASLTLLFERKWYGMEKSSPEDFQQCEKTFTELTSPLID